MTARPPATAARALLAGGRGVPDSVLAAACGSLALRLPDHGEDWTGQGVPCLLVATDGDAELDAGLKPPYAGFVEWRPGQSLTVTEACVEAVAAGGLALSVTTGRAYGLQLSAVFAAALAWRLDLPGDMAADIEMALQEAVANALVHGNLEISSEPRGDAAGFAAYCAMISERLADPVLALRRVEICAHEVPSGIRVVVADEGLGFDLQRELAREALCEDKSGRGLRIIKGLARRVEPQEGGRRLVMVF